MDELNKLKFQIERQKEYQFGPNSDEDRHDLYPDFFCEGLDWVLERIEARICAIEKGEHENELSAEQEVIKEHIQCPGCD